MPQIKRLKTQALPAYGWWGAVRDSNRKLEDSQLTPLPSELTSLPSSHPDRRSGLLRWPHRRHWRRMIRFCSVSSTAIRRKLIVRDLINTSNNTELTSIISSFSRFSTHPKNSSASSWRPSTWKMSDRRRFSILWIISGSIGESHWISGVSSFLDLSRSTFERIGRVENSATKAVLWDKSEGSGQVDRIRMQ